MRKKSVAAAALALGAGAFALAASVIVHAQSWPQNPQGWPQNSGAPPAPPSHQNPVCARLEGQLSALDRGVADPARAEQIKRYEDAAGKQQFELDRLVVQARRAGCEGSGFFLFGGQPPQCDGLNAQIQRMRVNLDRITMDMQRLQGGNFDQAEQRRALLVALGQNDCGPQYRAAAAPPRPRGFFESLFGGFQQSPGPGPGPGPGPDFINPDAAAGTYRTICVRTCDGFYFPISFATMPARFQEDEQTCQRMCPATEVALFAHRNPGEDASQAVSIHGRPYRDLPNAFRYRSEFNPSCSCRRPGQSWAEAMGQKDETVERGDIVVTEDRAKQMSLPASARTPGRQDTRRDQQKSAPSSVEPASPPPSATNEQATPAEKRSVRTIGPPYYPTR